MTKKHMKNEDNQSNGRDDNRINGPGELYSIGCTEAPDTYLLHPWKRELILGKPWVYLAVDVFSGLIAGVYVSFTPYGTNGTSAVKLVLENAIRNKADWCKELGIQVSDSDWPASGLPKAICLDCGEFTGSEFHGLAASLGVEVAYSIPGRVGIESVLSQVLKSLDHPHQHSTHSCSESKPGTSIMEVPEAGCNRTMMPFTKALTVAIINYNLNERPKIRFPSEMVAAGVEPRPVQIWTWGMVSGTGALRQERASLRIRLFPVDQAFITRKGICSKGLYYWNASTMSDRFFAAAAVHCHRKLEVRYDPSRVDQIFVPVPKNGEVQVFELTPACCAFRGLTWAEWIALKGPTHEGY